MLKLNLTQIKDKRDSIIFLKCNNIWSSGHKYKRPKLFLMEEDNETKGDGIFFLSTGDLIDLRDSYESNKKVEISQNVIIRSLNPRMMRIQIRINNQLLTAFMDTISSHDFIHSKAAKRLGVDISTHYQVMVKITDGTRITNKECYLDFRSSQIGFWEYIN